MNYVFQAIALFSLLILCTACPKPLSVNDVYHSQADTLIDESVHFKNSLEWWYFTGHLSDTLTGDQYGIEYVFFHFNPRDKSDYLMGNVAISDPQQKSFKYDYKMVKLDSLLTPQLPINLQINHGEELWKFNGKHGRYQLSAPMKRNPGYGLTLQTSPKTGAWMHGNGTGYQQYGSYAEAGYYSYPELEARGTLQVEGKSRGVKGTLWYDRQWNCIGVFQKEVAWDWMAIQLEGGEELMVFKLYHRKDNRIVYGGSYRDASGVSRALQPDDLSIEELEYWKSSRSKISYPVHWRVEVPALDLSLKVKARFPEQELSLKFAALVSLHYWEGMSSVTGTRKGEEVAGDAYVEITNRKWVQKNE